MLLLLYLFGMVMLSRLSLLNLCYRLFGNVLL